MTDTKDDYYARGFPPQIFVEAWGGRWSRHADGTQEMEYVRADRIEELESKLAKAVEALQWFIDNDDTNEGDEPMPDFDGRTWNELNASLIEGLKNGRATLAELKGDKNEKDNV
jgi:hypothetical protein